MRSVTAQSRITSSTEAGGRASNTMNMDMSLDDMIKDRSSGGGRSFSGGAMRKE